MVIRLRYNVAGRRLAITRDTGFVLRCDEDEFCAPALVIATGGLSIPKMGATAFGYDVARQFGLNIVPCRPALVPLMFRPEDCARYSDLAGVSAEVIASARLRAPSLWIADER